MKLLYIVHEYPPHTQTFVWREIEGLRSRGIDVTAYALRCRRGPRPAHVRCWRDSWRVSSGLAKCAIQLVTNRRSIWNIISLPPHGLRASLTQILAVGHAIVVASLVRKQGSEEEEKVHAHAHFLGRTLEVTVLASAITASIKSVSATGHAGDVTNPQSQKRLRELVGKLDGVVCASATTAAVLASETRRQDIRVIRCGVTSPGLSAHVLNDNPMLRLLSVGRLVEKKGFAYCVNAARLLVDLGYRIKWTIVGEGPRREELLQLVNNLHLADNVKLCGHLPNHQVMDIMRHDCDIFVLPSIVATDGDEDGIPVALMEAMSLSIPVVATRAGGIKELVADLKTGFIAEGSSSTSLAEVIVSVIDDPERARCVGLNGASHVEQSFSAPREVEKLQLMFEKLLSS